MTTLKIEQSRVFDGPSIWNSNPVTRLLVTAPPRFTWPDEIAARIETLSQQLCDPMVAPEPLELLAWPARDDWAGHVVVLLLNLQRLAGQPVTFGWHQAIAKDQVEIVVEHTQAAIPRTAVTIVKSLLESKSYDLLQFFLGSFWTTVETSGYGRGAGPIVEHACQRGIPVTRIDPSDRITELGNGSYRRRVQSTITSDTSQLADVIGIDKWLTKTYLRASGLPVAEGAIADTVDQAAAAARNIGYPVVLKPAASAGSVGVRADINNEAELRAAFADAAIFASGRVLVERQVEGTLHRAMVVNNRLESIVTREPATVTGDGVASVQALIDQANADPRRGKSVSHSMLPIEVDDALSAMLRWQKLDLTSVPADGQVVALRPRSNFNGSSTIDRTDVIHPNNVAILIQATKVVGLDVAAIDLISPDITQPLWANCGVILELNTGFSFRKHVNPSEGQGHDPAPAILDMLFPPGTPVRAPIVAVIGEGVDAIAREIGAALSASGNSVGLATSDGLSVGGVRIGGPPRRGPEAARTLLNNPGTELLVVAIDPQELFDEGLGFDYCDVAVVTSLSGLKTPSGKPVERVLTDLLDAKGTLFLNADAPGMEALADGSSARIESFRDDPTTAVVATIESMHSR